MLEPGSELFLDREQSGSLSTQHLQLHQHLHQSPLQTSQTESALFQLGLGLGGVPLHFLQLFFGLREKSHVSGAFSLLARHSAAELTKADHGNRHVAFGIRVVLLSLVPQSRLDACKFVVLVAFNLEIDQLPSGGLER